MTKVPQCSGEKDGPFVNGTWSVGNPYGKQIIIDSYLTYTKINFRWIIELNTKIK